MRQTIFYNILQLHGFPDYKSEELNQITEKIYIMGRQIVEYLEGSQIYICAQCQNHLTSQSRLISKAFQGRSGKAYLFHEVVNVTFGAPENKTLISGLHVVCDINCKTCKKVIGWKYIMAYDEAQKYKEGKSIIERAYMKKEKWDS